MLKSNATAWEQLYQSQLLDTHTQWVNYLHEGKDAIESCFTNLETFEMKPTPQPRAVEKTAHIHKGYRKADGSVGKMEFKTIIGFLYALKYPAEKAFFASVSGDKLYKRIEMHEHLDALLHIKRDVLDLQTNQFKLLVKDVNQFNKRCKSLETPKPKPKTKKSVIIDYFGSITNFDRAQMCINKHCYKQYGIINPKDGAKVKMSLIQYAKATATSDKIDWNDFSQRDKQKWRARKNVRADIVYFVVPDLSFSYNQNGEMFADETAKNIRSAMNYYEDTARRNGYNVEFKIWSEQEGFIPEFVKASEEINCFDTMSSENEYWTRERRLAHTWSTAMGWDMMLSAPVDKYRYTNVSDPWMHRPTDTETGISTKSEKFLRATHTVATQQELEAFAKHWAWCYKNGELENELMPGWSLCPICGRPIRSIITDDTETTCPHCSTDLDKTTVDVLYEDRFFDEDEYDEEGYEIEAQEKFAKVYSSELSREDIASLIVDRVLGNNKTGTIKKSVAKQIFAQAELLNETCTTEMKPLYRFKSKFVRVNKAKEMQQHSKKAVQMHFFACLKPEEDETKATPLPKPHSIIYRNEHGSRLCFPKEYYEPTKFVKRITPYWVL